MMKQAIALLFGLCFLLSSTSVLLARDVHVGGYYRGNGTYVRPHIRSSPDSSKWNNYGPSRKSDELMNPRSRDADKDGTPNYLDHDDNNNGIEDDKDSRQYSR